MNITRAIAAVENLPIHSISGYEWECYGTGCHYHWTYGETERVCELGHPITRDGEYDRDGVPCDHDALLDRERVLEALRGSGR